jgi:hypothetical protein
VLQSGEALDRDITELYGLSCTVCPGNGFPLRHEALSSVSVLGNGGASGGTSQEAIHKLLVAHLTANASLLRQYWLLNADTLTARTTVEFPN